MNTPNQLSSVSQSRVELTPVKLGIDRLFDTALSKIRNARVGIIGHAASVDSNYRHIVDLCLANNIDLQALFAPEHGFHAAKQDMVAFAEEAAPNRLAASQIPTYSLYGDSVASLAPKPEQLSNLDILIIDLQDVGSRYYTFAQTMAYAMRVAGTVGLKVIVLDRPNPIGGAKVEGSELLADYYSFCGWANVPQRHGLTIGELALLYKSGFGNLAPIDCDLEVIQLQNWKRSALHNSLSLPWILPSPNMPTLETALVYPGGCLFEATNISEGRGTTHPFEFLGAPYINGEQWRDCTIAQGMEQGMAQGINIKGAVLRPLSFMPQFHKWAGQLCGGVQIHVTDAATFQPFRLGLALIKAAYTLYPNHFRWRTETYEFISHINPIDLLYGSTDFRDLLERGGDLAELESRMSLYEEQYMAAREAHLLY